MNEQLELFEETKVNERPYTRAKIEPSREMDTGIVLDDKMIYVPYMDLLVYMNKPENKVRDCVEVWREFARNWIAKNNKNDKMAT